MAKKSLFIRFGLHKDRDVLEKSKELYGGIVLPAHILSYSQDATIAAVTFIDHEYFIDPMSYVLTSQTIKNYLVGPTEDAPNKAVAFKPSIKKLIENYGIYNFFEENNFQALQPHNALELADTFIENNIRLQLSRIDNGFAPAFKKYSKILKLTQKDRNPLFVTPPYFYFDNAKSSSWHNVNVEYAKKTKKKLADDGCDLKTIPILATDTSSLSAELINDYKEFGQVILWLSDLDESQSKGMAQTSKLKKYSDFVALATKSGLIVSNLYGSYYSIVCTKLGLEAIANGIFYGEHKNYKAKVGGGGPSSRFYISTFHKFFSIPTTIQIFEQYPELLALEPKSTRDEINNNPLNIATFDKRMDLAQIHFLEARKQELEKIVNHGKHELITELKNTYKKYSPLPQSIVEGDVLAHLTFWAEALEDKKEK